MRKRIPIAVLGVAVLATLVATEPPADVMWGTTAASEAEFSPQASGVILLDASSLSAEDRALIEAVIVQAILEAAYATPENPANSDVEIPSDNNLFTAQLATTVNPGGGIMALAAESIRSSYDQLNDVGAEKLGIGNGIKRDPGKSSLGATSDNIVGDASG